LTGVLLSGSGNGRVDTPRSSTPLICQVGLRSGIPNTRSLSVIPEHAHFRYSSEMPSSRYMFALPIEEGRPTRIVRSSDAKKERKKGVPEFLQTFLDVICFHKVDRQNTVYRKTRKATAVYSTCIYRNIKRDSDGCKWWTGVSRCRPSLKCGLV